MKIKAGMILMVAWWQSILAMLGSLYFSQVLRLPPCVLCWYQRIAMYPLVVILGVGLYLKDKRVVYYAAPLAIFGWLVAMYHNLLYYKFLPESIIPCKLGVSCTTKLIEWAGFITIPLLSLAGFSVILGCLWLVGRKRD